MRMMFLGVLYCAGLAGLVFLVSHISEVVAAKSPAFYVGVIALGIAVSIYRELSGGHHASAAPVRPSPPSA